MTIRELMEQAHLEALGLLDPADQAAFERAFAAAPPAIKAQLREEQARVAASETMLPDVEPSAELRERVLSAVTAAMIEDAAAGDPMELSAARRVPTWWRTAAVSLMTACVVLGAAFVSVYGSNRQLEERLTADRQTDVLTSTSGNATQLSDMLFSTDTRRIVFDRAASAPAAFQGMASIYVDAKWEKSRVYCGGLNPSREGEVYRVVLLTGLNQGVEQIGRTLHQFTSNQALNSFQIDHLEKGVRVAIVSAREGADPTILLTATI